MKTLVAAFGTRGDVQPMLLLAQALRARGHAVTLSVPPNSVAFARAHSFEPLAAGLDYEDISRRSVTGSLTEMMAVFPLLKKEVGSQLAVLEAPAASADVIVGSSVFIVGSILSEMLRKAYAFFALAPQMFPSAFHPSPPVKWLALPRFVNRASWELFELGMSRILRKTIDDKRRERSLAPARNVWRTLLGEHPVLACDDSLAPAPPDVRVTQLGAFFPPDDALLSPEAQRFLDAGAPPVYFGFGSMSDRDPAATTRLLVEAAKRAGIRALIQRGWANLGACDVGGGALVVGPEPHVRLFPRCAVIVHHGGAGTTHAAARAAVPQVVMPQLLDQHYWAHRVRACGLGTTVPRYGASAGRLARAIRGCDALRERARNFAANMRHDGIDRAVELIERLVR